MTYISVPSRLTLTGPSSDDCTIYFEPWGTEHVLARGDAMYVDSPLIAAGDVEVAYIDGGIMLWFRADGPVKISTRSGAQLDL